MSQRQPLLCSRSSLLEPRFLLGGAFNMYYAYFGLEKEPFSMTPDPGFLFLTAKHREALAGLLFSITSRKGFLVLTRDAGTGKTTLLSRVRRSIPPLRA